MNGCVASEEDCRPSRAFHVDELFSLTEPSHKAGSDRTEATSAEMSLDMGYNRG